MKGLQPLLTLRRKGFAPAGGVVIDLGLISYDWGTWHKAKSPWAFIRAELDEASDWRFVRALPTLIRVAPQATRQQIKTTTERVAAAGPKSLGVVLFDAALEPQKDDQGRWVSWSIVNGKWAKGWPEGVEL